MTTKNLLVYTVYDKKYEAYRPLFEYSFKKAWPEYGISCVCHDDWYREYPNKHPVQIMLHRYLHDLPGQLPGYKHYLAVDIDFLFYRQKEPILQFHLNEMQKSGRCYSNIRGYNKNAWGKPGRMRMSAVHFYSREWLVKTKDIRERYREALMNDEVGHKWGEDEIILWNICDIAGVGLPVEKYQKAVYAERHHAIHMGLFRKKGQLSSLRGDKNPNQILLKIARQFSKMEKDSKFMALVAQSCAINPQIAAQIKNIKAYAKL